jgi:hypothetical protein
VKPALKNWLSSNFFHRKLKFTATVGEAVAVFLSIPQPNWLLLKKHFTARIKSNRVAKNLTYEKKRLLF